MTDVSELLFNHSVPSPRSTAAAQRVRVVDSAVHVFAATGYHATPVADVARHAGISTAYVFRLFEGKTGLFTAAVDRCYDRLVQAMLEAPTGMAHPDPAAVLEAMSGAYADLVRDRDLLMMQVHAQSATTVPQVREALQRGLGALTTAVRERSGAGDGAVVAFFARGQLWNLVVSADVDGLDQPWARALTTGLTHLGEDR